MSDHTSEDVMYQIGMKRCRSTCQHICHTKLAKSRLCFWYDNICSPSCHAEHQNLWQNISHQTRIKLWTYVSIYSQKKQDVDMLIFWCQSHEVGWFPQSRTRALKNYVSGMALQKKTLQYIACAAQETPWNFNAVAWTEGRQVSAGVLFWSLHYRAMLTCLFWHKKKSIWWKVGTVHFPMHTFRRTHSSNTCPAQVTRWNWTAAML